MPGSQSELYYYIKAFQSVSHISLGKHRKNKNKTRVHGSTIEINLKQLFHVVISNVRFVSINYLVPLQCKRALLAKEQMSK